MIRRKEKKNSENCYILICKKNGKECARGQIAEVNERNRETEKQDGEGKVGSKIGKRKLEKIISSRFISSYFIISFTVSIKTYDYQRESIVLL